MIEKIRVNLTGLKTYLIAASAILAVAISWTNGSIDNVDAIKSIVEAILAMTIRAGITSSQTPK